MERDTIIKKDEYAKAGIKEYYILDAQRERTQFFRLNKTRRIAIKHQKGGIIKSKVLPGFQFRISDLFDKPSIDEMVENKVYQQFVMPNYLREKQARILAEQRAKQLAEQLRLMEHRN
ncbi:hypothetical protein PN36_04415 [Candidatus Thiomargarita nelsonii]|uniref:Putative restriction endonuclease domain-containing protein n=1 Tax=Candidatus Thiomargarita nelsonii TaxID=1003181 RepID=A0A4E0QW40_9GAMM|nr:hypothetical protein PN36_04415 [Candidatus Thiomargarita nelsonii]